MGMGLGIELISEWPQEVVRVRCPRCGSIVDITRYKRLLSDIIGRERPLPPELAAKETEQYCPVCGEALSSEIPVERGVIAWIREHKVLSLVIGTGVAGGLYGISRRN